VSPYLELATDPAHEHWAPAQASRKRMPHPFALLNVGSAPRPRRPTPSGPPGLRHSMCGRDRDDPTGKHKRDDQPEETLPFHRTPPCDVILTSFDATHRVDSPGSKRTAASCLTSSGGAAGTSRWCTLGQACIDSTRGTSVRIRRDCHDVPPRRLPSRQRFAT
jgi:hypothetical protein